MKVEAKWTGNYPNLCSGQWILKVNNKDVSHLIPEKLRDEPMHTCRTYQRWHFNNNWGVEWESYDDGLYCDEWIKENKKWLNKITTNYSTQEEIYEAINSQDWHYGECGGCI